MFRASATRLRALLVLVEHVLGDPEDVFGVPEDVFGEPEPPPAAHPHRRTIRIGRARRPGAVAPRPSHCLSPVRHGPGAPRARHPRSAA